MMCLANLLTMGSLPGAEPLDVGSAKQLFVGPWARDGRDEHLVESMKNVTMTMHEAHVTGERLIVRDKPWEGTRLLDLYMFVLKDDGIFRMYYGALPKCPKIWQEPNCRILCYAESKDGIHWEKPNLGLFEWEGSRDNNIIIPNDDFPYTMSEFAGPGVFIDPHAKEPHEKYKLIIKMTPVRPMSGREKHLKQLKQWGVPVDLTPGDPVPADRTLPKGQYMFGSPDGIRWRLLSPKKVNPGASDTKFSVFWDERIGKYVSYTRVKHQKEDSPTLRALQEYHQRQYGLRIVAPGRLVGRIDSDDLISWSRETAVLATDELDHVNPSADTTDGSAQNRRDWAKFGKGVDIYGGNISKYSEARDIYVGLPTFFYHWKTIEAQVGGHRVPRYTFPGTLDVQLVTSRDGVHFHRAPGRRPFIRLGPRGSWWSKMIWPSNSVVRVDDELWIYFSGQDVAHNIEQELLVGNGAHGRAILRLDGFISADAGYTGGELTTKPIVFKGKALCLNVDTGAGGAARVEVQDAQGKPIPGFALADADLINGNHIRVRATWNGSSDISRLAGTPVRLRFVMRSTKLYSFQFLADRH